MVIYRDSGVSFCDKLQQDCISLKKSEREEKKNVTSATNGFYRDYFVSVCNKV